MLSKITTVCLVAVLTCFVASSAFAAPGQTWSLSGDFSITNGNTNTPPAKPDGTWEYTNGADPMDTADTDWYVAEMPPNIAWHHSSQTANPWVSVSKMTDDYTNHTPAGCSTGCPQFLNGQVGGHGLYGINFKNSSGGTATYNISASGYNARDDAQNMHRGGTLDITGPGGPIFTLTMTGDGSDNIAGTHESDSASGISLAAGEYITATMNYNDWSGLELEITQVPEPSTVVLMLLGVLGLVGTGRRSRR